MPIHDWMRVNAGIFHHFHHEWISTLARKLNAGLLPPECYALAEQIAGGLGPDVLTLGTMDPDSPRPKGNGSVEEPSTGGVLLLEASPPRVSFTARVGLDQYARRRSRIAIRHSSGDAVIAVIEVVSPGNKATRYGLRSFVQKALELLDKGVHLLILDLFPPGPRDPQGIHDAIWSEFAVEAFRLPPGKPLTLVSYLAGEDKEAFIEPVAVGDSLPEMPLFLAWRRYVSLPLESTYCEAFAAVPKRWREQLEA